MLINDFEFVLKLYSCKNIKYSFDFQSNRFRKKLVIEFK